MPRCDECRVKFKATVFNQKFCKRNEDCLTAEAMYNLDQVKKKSEKEQKQRNDEFKKRVGPEVYYKENKKTLQAEINKLARLIDNSFDYGCISCGIEKNVQYAGGHRFSVGSNETIRYNLHDIHKQCNKNCNKELSGNPDGYDNGLISRYGEEYKELVHGLGLKYPYIGLKTPDYPEKIKQVRAIIRQFDTYQFKDAIKARELCNTLIGVYK